MVMERINGFTNMSKGILERFQGTDRTDNPEGKPSPEVDSSVPPNSSAPADTASISPKAHRLMDLRNAVESGREALDELPEVRRERVAQVRARLDRGYYNSVEVRARVAERLNHVAEKLEDL